MNERLYCTEEEELELMTLITIYNSHIGVFNGEEEIENEDETVVAVFNFNCIMKIIKLIYLSSIFLFYKGD